jgi:hypothetical protein
MSTPSSLATKDMILGSVDLKSEDVFVEEWQATVRVREMTGTERGIFEASVSKVTTTGGNTNAELDVQQLRVRLCALCMVDEDGQRLFADTEVEKLGAKSARALQAVFDVAARLSGISDSAVEEALGESEAIPQEVSS